VIVAPATGFTRPLTVAVSEIVPPPSGMFGEAIVAIVGVARETTLVSFASLHRPDTGALLASPLYEAIHLYVPACVGVNAPEE